MKNRLDVAVSYYEHIYTKFPVRATLIDLLTTNRYKSRVLAVRTESDARKKKELKTRLPAFTPSGLFRGGAANTLLKLTGLICIDIDRKDNLQVEGYDRLKDQLGRLPYVAFCGRSAGGEGYYAIVPIAQPNKLLLHFRSLQTEFSAMGITKIRPAVMSPENDSCLMTRSRISTKRRKYTRDWRTGTLPGTQLYPERTAKTNR